MYIEFKTSGLQDFFFRFVFIWLHDVLHHSGGEPL